MKKIFGLINSDRAAGGNRYGDRGGRTNPLRRAEVADRKPAGPALRQEDADSGRGLCLPGCGKAAETVGSPGKKALGTIPVTGDP